MQEMRRRHNIGSEAFNELARFVAEILTPKEGNLVPPSLHLQNDLLGYVLRLLVCRAATDALPSATPMHCMSQIKGANGWLR